MKSARQAGAQGSTDQGGKLDRAPLDRKGGVLPPQRRDADAHRPSMLRQGTEDDEADEP